MNKETYDRGFTVKRATDQIYRREDNAYNRKTIEKVLKMYAEECMEILINGGKLNIKGVGTIRPNIIHSVHCGLEAMKNREDDSYTVARLNIRTSEILKRQLKERLDENLKRGIDGLGGVE